MSTPTTATTVGAALAEAYARAGRPTATTDPADCRWCWGESFGGDPCPYHGEKTGGAQDAR